MAKMKERSLRKLADLNYKYYVRWSRNKPVQSNFLSISVALGLLSFLAISINFSFNVGIQNFNTNQGVRVLDSPATDPLNTVRERLSTHRALAIMTARKLVGRR